MAAVDDDGQRADGYLATTLKFALTIPVGDDGGKMVVRAFRSAGIAVEREALRGAQKLTGTVDDTTAPALYDVRFQFSEEDLTHAATCAAEATARTGRRCVECGKPIPGGRSPLTKVCSDGCHRERQRKLNLIKYHRSREREA